MNCHIYNRVLNLIVFFYKKNTLFDKIDFKFYCYKTPGEIRIALFLFGNIY